MKLHHAKAFVAILLACTGSAHAGSVAFGTSDISFHVVDLAPDDGIASGASVTQAWSDLDVYLRRPEGSRGHVTTVLGLHDFTAEGTVYGAHAAAAVTSLLGDTTVTYSEPAPAPGYTFAAVSVWQTITLTLSANSLLVVDGNAFAQLSGWDPSTEFEGIVALTLRHGPAGTWDGQVNDAVRSIDYSTGTDTIQALQVAYANTTDEDETLRLRVLSSFYFTPDSSILSPVPEPATYGLLGAGLLVIGALRRRNLHKDNNHA